MSNILIVNEILTLARSWYELLTALKTMSCSIELRITTTITGRTVLIIITGEIVVSSYCDKKVSESLHPKGVGGGGGRMVDLL